jgi:hypothetical protein
VSAHSNLESGTPNSPFANSKKGKEELLSQDWYLDWGKYLARDHEHEFRGCQCFHGNLLLVLNDQTLARSNTQAIDFDFTGCGQTDVSSEHRW